MFLIASLSASPARARPKAEVLARVGIGIGGLAERRGSDGVGGRAPGPRAVTGARPGRPGPLGRGGRCSRQGRGAHLRIILEFHWRISGSSVVRQVPEWASSAGDESPERIGQSRAATRSLPAELRQLVVKFTRLGRGRLGYPRDLGPERIEAASDTRCRQGPGGRLDHRAIVGN